jgi:predicted DNA-binding transcriptional regulator AlpA
MTMMLRTEEAAEFLGLSPGTLATWRVRGGGPRYRKLGRVVVYDPTDLRAWLDERIYATTSSHQLPPDNRRRNSR